MCVRMASGIRGDDAAPAGRGARKVDVVVVYEVDRLTRSLADFEVEGKGSNLLKIGEAAIVPAELVHLVRNDSLNAQSAGGPQ
jgi:hypothetical protein